MPYKLFFQSRLGMLSPKGLRSDIQYNFETDCYNIPANTINNTPSHASVNLGQNKKEQLTPFPPPQSNDEGGKEQKRAILASLKWGEWWSRCFIYFVQDCSFRLL